MRRSFAVEGEPRSVAVRADRDHPAAVPPPCRATARATVRGARASYSAGSSGLCGEQVEDVGQQQFLMLLLVGDAEVDQRARIAVEPVPRRVERGVDMPAPRQHLGQRRARQQAARGARMARARPPRNSC